MTAPMISSFDDHIRELSEQIAEMSKNVAQRYKTLPEQLKFRHVREQLDALDNALQRSVPPPKSKEAVQVLSIKLERLAAEVQKVTGSFLNEEYVEDISVQPSAVGTEAAVMVPLCSVPTSSRKFENVSDEYRRRIAKLDRQCSFIRIKGDGDCLFRSFATGLLIHFLKHKEESEKIFSKIRSGVGKKIDQDTWDKGMKAVKALSKCQTSEDVAILMNNSEFSNGLTRLMRHLAAAGLEEQSAKVHGYTDTILQDFPQYHGNFAKYLSDLRTLDSGSSSTFYGGGPEVGVLEGLFNIPEHHPIFIDDHIRSALFDPDSINLLFSGAHYNLAIPKERGSA